MMVHGPCDQRCLKGLDPKCSKRYPREYCNETICRENGYPVYRRRNDGRFVVKGDHRIDNRWIIPHNLYLCTKFNAHINVEICSSISAVKYLFKYVYKGHDRATLQVENEDEIKSYLDARYVGASEAAWRVFAFKMHDGNPSIQRLQIHLEGEQFVTFNEERNVREVLEQSEGVDTTLMGWFKANETLPGAAEVSYVEFPKYFTWNSSGKYWKVRQAHDTIGRIYWVDPRAGEQYFLRLLLNHVKGATSFTDLRTYNGVILPSFREAVIARGLFGVDNEWDSCLMEAATMQSGKQLRLLFVTILVYGNDRPFDARALWCRHEKNLIDDCAHILSMRGISQPSHEQVQSLALQFVEEHLQSFGNSLEQYNLPIPNRMFQNMMSNDSRLIREEISYCQENLQDRIVRLEASLNVKQHEIYNHVVDAIQSNTSSVFFIDGPGGTGKSYLENLILCRVRVEGGIALAVASSGIAALLLEGGRTAHSRFKIPIDLDSTTICCISKQGELGDLIRQTKIILWDEISMMDKFAFEAVDRSLRDIRDCDMPFGGIIVILGGDFRQIAPVVKRGGRSATVSSSVKQSYLWQHVRCLRLEQNMRIIESGNVHDEDEDICGPKDFSNWLLAIGNNQIPFIQDDLIICPRQMVLPSTDIEVFVRAIYGNLRNVPPHDMRRFFSERAILGCRNDDVHEINSLVLSSIIGESREYLSADSVLDQDEGGEDVNVFPPEYLNTLCGSGMAYHKLELKIGTPVMLLRNLDATQGLCNGTRLIITNLGSRVIQAEILSGANVGKITFIPRVTMISNVGNLPFRLRRRQFPIRLAYAMTINKSQGQTLDHVGLDLRRSIFSHGQLYVALSRVRKVSNLKIFFGDKFHSDGDPMLLENIVYTELL